MGVCRGRLSEGLDFKDRKGRCVIIVGIPYPNAFDPKIILKKQFLDEKVKLQGFEVRTDDGKTIQNIPGNYWYSQLAYCAVNQAIGRVIRHVRDFGSILLFDKRYADRWNREKLSRWLQDCITSPSTIDEGLNKLESFY